MVRNVVERQWQHHNQLESSGSKETVITLSKPRDYVTRMFEPALIWGSRWQCQPDTALWHPCLKPKAAKTLHQVTQRKRYDLKFLLHQFFCGPIFDHPEIKLIYFLRHKSSGKSKRPLQKHAADRTLALPLQEFLYPDIN